ncbi:phosphotransferase enzyme family protein [Risungbinella massiliensis]|uniref:phosphotransferase enzyme family protein n=1 Tax=Risungbinella massiliensis TaxID=1329796 RepID=UPI0005CBBB8A|nr:phosphotransferase [Risungbinella massiliensis]
MEKKRIYQVTDEVFHEIEEQYGWKILSMRLRRGSVNIVYELQTNNKTIILRCSPNHRREPWDVEAEVHFVDYLAKNGASATSIFSTKTGAKMIEVAGFYVVCFEKASGIPLEFEDWTDEYFLKWGKMTGQFHQLAMEYQAPSPTRKQWDQEEWFQLDKYLPKDQCLVYQRATELIEQIQSFPQTPFTYGLIHYDLHNRNFHMTDDGVLCAFDFEDCCYHYYLQDIAVSLYHALTRLRKPPLAGKDEVTFTRRFLRFFLAGYQTEKALDSSWMEQLQAFLQLRRVFIYLFYVMDYDLANLSPQDQQIVDQTRMDIEQARPIGYESKQDLVGLV